MAPLAPLIRKANSIVVRVPARLGLNATFSLTALFAPAVPGVQVAASMAIARRRARRIDVWVRVVVGLLYTLAGPLTLTVTAKVKRLIVPLIPMFEPEACL